MVKTGSELRTAYNMSDSEEDLLFAIAVQTDDVPKSSDCLGRNPRTRDLVVSRGIQQSNPDLIYHEIVWVPIRINYPHTGNFAAVGSLIRLELKQIPQIRGSLQLVDREIWTGTHGPQDTWKAYPYSKYNISYRSGRGP